VYPGAFDISWVQGLGFTDLGRRTLGLVLGLVLGLGFIVWYPGIFVVSWYLCGILACLWHVCGMLAISYNALLHACSKNFSFFIIFLSHTHTHTRGIITRSEPRDPLVCIPLRFVPINTHTNTNTHTHTHRVRSVRTKSARERAHSA